LDGHDENGGPSPIEFLDQVALDLDKLEEMVQKMRSSASALNQPALRALATEALKKATGLCTMLIALLQDLPLS